MPTTPKTTLCLHLPQWQGGHLHNAYFDAQLLAWLAPPATGTVETALVSAPKSGESLEVENGMSGRTAQNQASNQQPRLSIAFQAGNRPAYKADHQ